MSKTQERRIVRNPKLSAVLAELQAANVHLVRAAEKLREADQEGEAK
jgi:hypothetical protein